MDQHREAVAQIAAHVRGFYERKESFRIYHGATNSTRRSAYRRDQIIDTSKLKHVLHINKTTKTALVEPNVPMDALVEATLKHELIPPVVMELPGITVGGSRSKGTNKHGPPELIGAMQVALRAQPARAVPSSMASSTVRSTRSRSYWRMARSSRLLTTTRRSISSTAPQAPAAPWASSRCSRSS